MPFSTAVKSIIPCFVNAHFLPCLFITDHIIKHTSFVEIQRDQPTGKLRTLSTLHTHRAKQDLSKPNPSQEEMLLDAMCTNQWINYASPSFVVYSGATIRQ